MVLIVRASTKENPMISPLTLHDTAPSFETLDQNETLIRLEQFQGQWVVIYFYPKALTPGCTVQACALRDGMEELARLGAVVLGISPDTPKMLKKFKETEQLNFTLLSDTSHQIAEAYGAWQEKSMYGKTYMGMARMTVAVNPAGNIAQVWPRVDPKTHFDQILGFLKAQA
jgi:thioredoxin-dependent peroxiredoxin